MGVRYVGYHWAGLASSPRQVPRLFNVQVLIGSLGKPFPGERYDASNNIVVFMGVLAPSFRCPLRVFQAYLVNSESGVGPGILVIVFSYGRRRRGASWMIRAGMEPTTINLGKVSCKRVCYSYPRAAHIALPSARAPV
ncbi:hypothetical protein PM082_015221 [Marasmius tenuissimus]|nr:hypothetical protein PM082_015221 [Marasmius tenuissimus]